MFNKYFLSLGWFYGKREGLSPGHGWWFNLRYLYMQSALHYFGYDNSIPDIMILS